MTYDGGKNGEGVYQAIINQMPPHRVYIEAFGGSGAIIRRKRRAVVNLYIERDPITVAAVSPLLTAVDVVEADALEWLKDYPAADKDVLIYADPPYLMETRSCQRDLYRCEFSSIEEHRALLQLAKSLPCLWMISGYRSALYDVELAGWRRVDFPAMTRRGLRTESLWCNFPYPVELHDYSFLGRDNIDRQRIKRKKERWKKRLLKMSVLERTAVLSAIQDLALQTETASLPAAQPKATASAGSQSRLWLQDPE